MSSAFTPEGHVLHRQWGQPPDKQGAHVDVSFGMKSVCTHWSLARALQCEYHCMTLQGATGSQVASVHLRTRTGTMDTSDRRWHRFWRKVKPARAPVPNFSARAIHLLHTGAGMVDYSVEYRSSLLCIPSLVVLPKSMCPP